jgi:hypothetical protein
MKISMNQKNVIPSVATPRRKSPWGSDLLLTEKKKQIPRPYGPRNDSLLAVLAVA